MSEWVGECHKEKDLRQWFYNEKKNWNRKKKRKFVYKIYTYSSCYRDRNRQSQRDRKKKT